MGIARNLIRGEHFWGRPRGGPGEGGGTPRKFPMLGTFENILKMFDENSIEKFNVKLFLKNLLLKI